MHNTHVEKLHISHFNLTMSDPKAKEMIKSAGKGEKIPRLDLAQTGINGKYQRLLALFSLAFFGR